MTGTILEQLNGKVQANLEWRGGSIDRRFGNDWVLYVTTEGLDDAKALIQVEEALRAVRAMINQEIGGLPAIKGNV